MFNNPGTQVRIIEDCRKGVPSAKGQVGLYERDGLRTVVVMYFGEWHEYRYNAFVAGEIKFNHGRPVIDVLKREEEIVRPPWITNFTEFEDWCKKSAANFWYPDYNPVIRLSDGTVIWGDECWWEPWEPSQQDHTLEQAEQSLGSFKEILRETMKLNT